MNLMKKTLARIALASTTFLPVVALAQFGEINTFVGKVTTFINNVLIPLIFAVALLVFIWGMFKYFINKGAEEKEQGKTLALYAVVGFVLMVSIWGIVNVVAGGLGLSGEQIQNLPSIPTR